MIRVEALLERAAGRPGAAAMRALLTGGFTRSEAERRLLKLIRRAELPAPETNVRVARTRSTRYRLLRATWHQITTRPEAIAARVAALLAT